MSFFFETATENRRVTRGGGGGGRRSPLPFFKIQGKVPWKNSGKKCLN